MFDKLKMFKNFVDQLGSNKGNWDCSTKGHFVSPNTIEEKKEKKEFRFISTCWACKKTLFFELALDAEKKLVVSFREYNTQIDLKRYFNSITENQFIKPEDMIPSVADHDISMNKDGNCLICSAPIKQTELLTKMCLDHNLEALLHRHLRAIKLERAIDDIRSELIENPMASMTATKKIQKVASTMVQTLQGQDLSDFILLIPNIVKLMK